MKIRIFLKMIKGKIVTTHFFTIGRGVLSAYTVLINLLCYFSFAVRCSVWFTEDKLGIEVKDSEFHYKFTGHTYFIDKKDVPYDS